MMKYTTISAAAVALGISHNTINAFTALQITTLQKVHHAATLDDVAISESEDEVTDDSKELKRQQLKQALLGRLGDTNTESIYDPVLCDPFTQESLSLSSIKGPILGGARSGGVRLSLTSESGDTFEGRTNTYINLLEPASAISEEKTTTSPILSSILTFTPPPLRSIIASNLDDVEYVPMRDLFTSPSVSFAYERGWRQGFAAAGFPGADEEFELATEYFSPVIEQNNNKNEDTVLVDMSCATGLFTRRFTKSNTYSRVIACDYSDSMLTEARRRLNADSEISESSTKLDLVRCDVAKIPMKTDSVDVFHAGAAMHCWPEIEASLKEIHRVLTPGGRYFATTFLGNYFSTVAGAEKASNGGADVETSMQAFQYFPSVEYLKDLLLDAGFENENVSVELVGRGCVVMQCEK